jgi:hypothetical protein
MLPSVAGTSQKMVSSVVSGVEATSAFLSVHPLWSVGKGEGQYRETASPQSACMCAGSPGHLAGVWLEE